MIKRNALEQKFDLLFFFAKPQLRKFPQSVQVIGSRGEQVRSASQIDPRFRQILSGPVPVSKSWKSTLMVHTLQPHFETDHCYISLPPLLFHQNPTHAQPHKLDIFFYLVGSTHYHICLEKLKDQVGVLSFPRAIFLGVDFFLFVGVAS